jgi:hypothetical protein
MFNKLNNNLYMSYNYLRSRSNNSLSGSNTQQKLANIQKREKLKGLLITKFMKMLGIKSPEKLLEDEISKFLQREKLTELDLKKLEERVVKLLAEKKNQETLKQNLEHVKEQHNYANVRLPDIADTASVYSKMSGASHLSKVNEHNGCKSARQEQCCDNDELNDSSDSYRPPVPRLDFSKEGDEWNAIAMYNQKMFQEERKQEKIKDHEVKRRTREDLDNQIRHKLRRLHEDGLKTREHDEQVLTHLEFLNKLEQEKQAEIKRKMLVEKDNRDKQLRDEKLRKKVEITKEKKYEKELVKALLSDMEREKQIAIKKKQEERESLQKTLKDNELNKIKTMEQLRKERAEDIQIMDEYAKVLDKQEQDRAEYFKRIERNANNFMSMMGGTVLKEQNERNKAEEDRMNYYLAERERK